MMTLGDIIVGGVLFVAMVLAIMLVGYASIVTAWRKIKAKLGLK